MTSDLRYQLRLAIDAARRARFAREIAELERDRMEFPDHLDSFQHQTFHGTESGYSAGCRCEECRKTAAVARARRREKECKCDECRTARNQARARSRARSGK